ncbi:hypothetical protein GCM10010446_50820 [Streptomyces enissocaesilis]|uniref:Uncharacterized protein n=1 Tax=Streptomyces enissocaesilis TaxID=332589 RepID=A0ABN3XJI1_9ACTN
MPAASSSDGTVKVPAGSPSITSRVRSLLGADATGATGAAGALGALGAAGAARPAAAGAVTAVVVSGLFPACCCLGRTA